MKISDVIIPNGVDFKKFRKFARTANYHYDSHETSDIEAHIRSNDLGKVDREIKDIFSFLLKHKYIKLNTSDMRDISGNKINKVYYGYTNNLGKIAGVSLNKRKNSNDAWIDVAKSVARAVAINKTSDNWLNKSYNEILIFGSMVKNNNTDFGNANLVLNMKDIKSEKEWHKTLDKTRKYTTENSQFFRSDCWMIGTFACESQSKLDIRHQNNFINFYNTYSLNSIQKEKKDELAISLWVDKNAPGNLDNIKLMDKNSIDYKSSMINFNKALKLLGLPKTNNSKFEKECIYFYMNEAASDLHKMALEVIDIEENKKARSTIEQMARMGNYGIESFGIYLAKVKETKAKKTDEILNKVTIKHLQEYFLELIPKISDIDFNVHLLKGLKSEELKSDTAKLNNLILKIEKNKEFLNKK